MAQIKQSCYTALCLPFCPPPYFCYETSAAPELMETIPLAFSEL